MAKAKQRRQVVTKYVVLADVALGKEERT